MEFLQPRSLAEAIAAKAQFPDAVPIAGGTDVMVEINFDVRRPRALLDLTRVSELTSWQRSDGLVRLGAGVTYARLIAELGGLLPGLAMAARTIGSPQIRNRGTVGGNLGAASPAGDCHPVLLASGATVEVTSARGSRLIPVAEFFIGPKRHALAADELITSVLIPAAPGPQQFAKIGTRNAMVIAVCAFALELRCWPRGDDPPRPPRSGGTIPPIPPGGGPTPPNPPGGEPIPPNPLGKGPVPAEPAGWVGTVGTGIGSAGPTPLRAPAAEEFLAGALAESGLWESGADLPDQVSRRFGELVAAAAQPIDDVRGTAAYRRHALSVLARRTLAWAWDSYRQDRQ
jgi:CO/xanthine dehydrogenase FAD-binding subunit